MARGFLRLLDNGLCTEEEGPLRSKEQIALETFDRSCMRSAPTVVYISRASRSLPVMGFRPGSRGHH